MTTPFLGEIQTLAFTFAPSGWALCNGTTLSIQQHGALFSLIGTSYGGNGTSTFQLPNLAARAPCSWGTGPGLTQRTIGEPFGEISVSVTVDEMAKHNHGMTAYGIRSTTNKVGSPVTNAAICGPGGSSYSAAAGTVPDTTFAPAAVAMNGGSQPHENRQPFLAITYAIALNGAFPAFN
jgi:microcystin-dependent protein